MATEELAVRLRGEEVGALVKLRNGRVSFVFDPRYTRQHSRPVLGLSFLDPSGEVREGRRASTGGGRSPPYFANLLPEGHMRSYLAAKAGVAETLDFPLLQLLGRDLPGAVELIGVGAQAPSAFEGDGPRDHADRPGLLRFSLAGVQLKFSAVAEASGGLTVPARGMGGDWIVKLPSSRFDGVPENEFSVMRMAAMCGIETPEVRLVPVADVAGRPGDLSGDWMDGRQALAVRRFDRAADGRRVHTEDFAQVFGQYPQAKYDGFGYRDIARVLGAFAGGNALGEFSRRLIYCAMVGNADMHLKNWSLIYREPTQAELSPAYDLLSTTACISDEAMALRLGGAKRWDELTLADFAEIGENAFVGGDAMVGPAVETVERFRTVWLEERHHLPLSTAVGEAIDRQLNTVPAANPGRMARRHGRGGR
ncbi:MAG: type II toxin-antitoxin system HipA family toxin [Gammaproteobacteria bacterium]|nr:type II toxin-antitoxin system HipA family toxin [Gammaproteobacteria bacterium]